MVFLLANRYTYNELQLNIDLYYCLICVMSVTSDISWRVEPMCC